MNTTATVAGNYDQTWEALIDLFSEKSWTIQNMDRSSGLITTDWMSLGSEAGTYADCGSPGLASVIGTAVRFNVRVKDADSGTSIAVNAVFRQQRVFDNRPITADCTSMGAVERLIHREVDTRAARARLRGQKVKTVSAATPPRGFYCASSPTATAAGFCTRERSDCQRTRESMVAVVADLSECALVEKALCFVAGTGDERCSPTAEACTAKRTQAGIDGDCQER